MKKKKERKKNDEREVLVEAEVGAGLTVETDEGAQEAEIGGQGHGLERRSRDIHQDLDPETDTGRSTGGQGQDQGDREAGREVDLEGQGQDLTNAKEAKGQEVDHALGVKV